MSENRSPEAAEMAAEYEADRQANMALRDAAIHEAKAKVLAAAQAAEVERAKALVLTVLAWLVGTATLAGVVAGVTAWARWVF